MRIVAGILVFLLIGAPAASEGQTLRDTLAKAYLNNPALKAARARLEAADEELAGALSAWRPELSLSGSNRWNDNTKTGTTSTASASMRFNQRVYAGGQTAAGIAQARSKANADRANLYSVEQNTLLAAATAHADVVRNQAVLELNENNERVLRQQMKAAVDRFELGAATSADAAQAKFRLSRSQADIIAAEGTLKDSRVRYERSVGSPVGVLLPASPLGELPTTLEEAIKRARENNFEIRRARHTEDAAHSGIRAVWGELLPNVSLTGELSVRERGFGEDASITARMTVPLYESGSVRARVRRAKHLASQRREDRLDAVLEATKTTAEAWHSLQSARARIEALSSGVNAAKIALEAVQTAAALGARTVLDVLNAEQDLLDTRVSLMRARRDEFVASFRLRQTIGTLTADQLNLPIKRYDARSRYAGSAWQHW